MVNIDKNERKIRANSALHTLVVREFDVDKFAMFVHRSSREHWGRFLNDSFTHDWPVENTNKRCSFVQNCNAKCKVFT